MLPLALGVFIGGAIMLRAAIRGENPLTSVMDALQGKAATPPAYPLTGSPSSPDSAPAQSTTGRDLQTPTSTVPAGAQGSTTPPSRALQNPTGTAPRPPVRSVTTPTVPRVGVPGPAQNTSGAQAQRMQEGLPPKTQTLWRALASFPGVTQLGAWGTRSYKSFHRTAEAIDASVVDRATGDRLAAWLLQHATTYGVTELIWYEHIATARRGWTWRPYTGPGGPHKDHVHVTVPK